uniref:Ribonuclease H-like domain-containing protein n=1 Tax=Tanacetum cinerariifolium TaxID=118510 RepID=A0A6L2PA51_TANCI|nr:ribonuclease H-like domain-containing protein [Tanacetum cinerariifolium]
MDPNWRNVMYDEYNTLVKNGTWLLVLRPAGVNMVCSMWLFKHKFHADGNLSRYKARLVANGSSQQLDVDFDETFSPVVKPTIIRTVFSLAVSRQWPIHQLDVKNAFLNDDLSETIIGSLNNEFDMFDLGALNYFLGIFADRTPTGLFFSQKKYALQLIERAHMVTCNPSQTPVDTESKLGPKGDPTLYRSLAGGLKYLTFTCPNLSYVVQHICLYMHDPRELHLAALKRILRYVQGSLDLGLHLYASCTTSLVGYTDADWAGCPSTRRSTSGYCVFLGDNLLSWSAKRQHPLSRSSAEAEYQGVAKVVAETAWLRNFLRELHSPLSTATLVYCDNVSAVYMSANPVQHQRTKHIEIDIHFVRDMVTAGQFWQTATASTLNNREMEIKVKVVTEASVRRHLKLEDSDGISNLRTTEIFEQLALMGRKTEVPQPSSPLHTNVSDEAASTGVDVRHGGAATTVTSLDARQGSEIQRRYDQDMDFNLDFDAAKEVSTAEKEVSTAKPVSIAGAAVSTASVDVSPASPTRRVSTADDITMANTLENIRARVEADEELTQRLQAEERNKYSEVDQANMLVDLINQRKRYFAAQKAEARRNKPMTQAQQRTYMSNYIKHMGSHTLQQAVEAELDYEGFKRQKTNEASGSEQPDEKENELSQEDLQQMILVVQVEEVYVEALQVKYPISDWEKMMVKFIRVRIISHFNFEIHSITRSCFEKFPMNYLKERFSSTEPTDDKERNLWVELKRLFEPDTNDTLWKLQRYMHDPLTWRLYDTCGVHHVSTEKEIDIFRLVEKEYPLSKGIMTLMLVNKLLVDQHSEMANELLRKIFILASRPRH